MRKKITRSRRSKFMTMNCRAMTVSLVFASFARIRSSPNLRFPSPNFPSISFRFVASWRSCFRSEMMSSFGGLPSLGPLSRMPNSLQ